MDHSGQWQHRAGAYFLRRRDGFEPSAEVQRLELSEIGEQRVSFTAISEGGMKSLGYSRSGNTFSIDLGMPNGNAVALHLDAVE